MCDWQTILTCACNELTSFEYVVQAMTGNWSYWIFRNFAWKNSWDHLWSTYFRRVSAFWNHCASVRLPSVRFSSLCFFGAKWIIEHNQAAHLAWPTTWPFGLLRPLVYSAQIRDQPKSRFLGSAKMKVHGIMVLDAILFGVSILSLVNTDCDTYMQIRYHSRFFDCILHPNLSATLDTDQKLPLSCLRISYQSLAECHLP